MKFSLLWKITPRSGKSVPTLGPVFLQVPLCCLAELFWQVESCSYRDHTISSGLWSGHWTSRSLCPTSSWAFSGSLSGSTSKEKIAKLMCLPQDPKSHDQRLAACRGSKELCSWRVHMNVHEVPCSTGWSPAWREGGEMQAACQDLGGRGLAL